MEEIKKNIELAIGKINKILAEDDFSAFHRIKQSLNTALVSLNENSQNEAKKELLFSIRLLMEAPPSHKELGLETLVFIDNIYKELSAVS